MKLDTSGKRFSGSCPDFQPDSISKHVARKNSYTMFLQSLTSSYLEYKADTNSVAQWLASTAIKYGYPKDLLLGTNQQQQVQQPSRRLKGKARKLAREATAEKPQNSAAPANEQQNIPRHIIAIKEFTTLAEYIAGRTNPPVRVPGTFISAIDRAISVRRSHGLEAAALQPDTPETRDSNESHGFFIGVLQRVRDVLRPRMLTEQTGVQVSTEDQLTEDAQRLANKFEGLEVEEPSETFLQAPDVTVPKKEIEKPDAIYEAERLQDMEEAMLSFTLLIQDYNELRRVLMHTWNLYGIGMYSLVAVALTTNTALDLARSMEEDIKPLLAKHGGSERLLQLYYLGLCFQKGEDQAFRERPGDGMNFEMYEESKNIYWPTYQLLQAFAKLVDNRHLPEYKPGFFGTYDPALDRSTLGPREKFREDQQVFMEVLPEFAYLCFKTDRKPPEDELTRGLREVFMTHEIPYWVIFASQVFLDIHHVLRGKVDRGYNDLCRIATEIDGHIEDNQEFHKSLRVDTWPRENDLVLKQLQNDIKNHVMNDPIQKAKIRLKRSPGEPFLLHKWHPLYCGMWAYNIQAWYQDIGITFVGAWGSALYAYHFYNALKQERLIEHEWKDMELFKKLHGESVFPGGPPTTPHDYFKRYSLSMGYSASSFARNRRQTSRPEASKKGPKGFEPSTPVMETFRERFCHGSGQSNLTKQDLERILAESKWVNEKNSQRKGKKRQSLEAHGQQSQAPDSLLLLRNAIQAEHVAFTFEYLVFHKDCWTLLRRLKDACAETLNRIHGVGWLEQENQLPFTVGWIFMGAAKAQTVEMQMALGSSGRVVSKLLLEGATAYNDFIHDGFGESVVHEQILYLADHGVTEGDQDTTDDSDDSDS